MKGLVLTLLLTYGGALASLVNPFVGLQVYVAFAILKPDSLWSYSLPQGGRYSLIVALGLLAGWAAHGFGNWRFGRAKPIVLALLAFWGCLIVSAFASRHPDRAWPQVEVFSKTFLPCLVAITIIDSMEKLRRLAWVIVVCQGYLAYEFNVQYYEIGFNDHDWVFGGMDNNCMAIAMVTCIGLAFFLGMHARSLWQKGLAFGLAALMAHFILFSMSRGGMLGLGIMGLVIFLVLPKRPSSYAVFLVGVLVVLRLAGPSVVEEFSTIGHGDVQGEGDGVSRTELWKACIQAALERPATGLGPANWVAVSHEYGSWHNKASHTTWLNVLAEEGFPGFLAFVAFFALCLIRMWPFAREKCPVEDPWMRYLARAVIASLVGFAVSAQFVALEGLETPYYIVILGAGVLKLSSSTIVGPADLVWQEAPVGAPMQATG